MKIHNFSAGPSILPRSVIEQASNGILNINNSDLSLIEISHRSKDFVEIMDRATTLCLRFIKSKQQGLQSFISSRRCKYAVFNDSLQSCLKIKLVILILELGQLKP